MSQLKVTFCGGTGMVTGSNFLVEDTDSDLKILIDCGLAQGGPEAEVQNWQPFPYDPSKIQYLIVTHGHIDHIGRIPKLVREGFRGKIISTQATKALTEPLLEDALELLFHAAQHHGRPPLYEKGDIQETMRLWHTIGYHEPQELAGGLTLEFLDAGHILGSAMAKLSRGSRSITFTGDLGGNSDLLPPRDSAKGTEYLVMESVYGDRTHPPENRRDELERVIKESIERHGTLLIPAFSTERTQDLLFEIRTLLEGKRIADLPVYIDSPLAGKITQAFLSNPSCFNDDIAKQIGEGRDVFSFPGCHFTESAEESHQIDSKPNPKIIIAGSGMSTGGRVLAHEKEVLPQGNATLLIVGYQAVGSIGRRVLDGEKKLSIQGEKVPVRAHIEHIFGYSAHIDGPHLLEFAQDASEKLEKVFVVMGEPASAQFLSQRIRDFLGIEAAAPEAGQSAVVNV